MYSIVKSSEDGADESHDVWSNEEMMVISGGSVRVVSEIKTGNIL